MTQQGFPPRKQLRLLLHYMPDNLDYVSTTLMHLHYDRNGVPHGSILASEPIRLWQAPSTLEAAVEAVDVALAKWRLW